MGQRFSHLAYVIQLRYNHIVEIFNEQIDRADKIQSTIDEVINKYPNDFNYSAIEEVLFFIDKRVTEKSVFTFIKKAAKHIEKGAWEELDELIVAREKAVKSGRSKLRNPKYKGEERITPRMLSFRWDEIVYRVITEIKEAK